MFTLQTTTQRRKREVMMATAAKAYSPLLIRSMAAQKPIPSTTKTVSSKKVINLLPSISLSLYFLFLDSIHIDTLIIFVCHCVWFLPHITAHELIFGLIEVTGVGVIVYLCSVNPVSCSFLICKDAYAPFSFISSKVESKLVLER